MSTKTKTRRRAAKAQTQPGALHQIENRQQQRNLQEHLIREARPDNMAFWQRDIGAIQQAKRESMLDPLVRENIEFATEWCDLSRKHRAGKLSGADAVRYATLRPRYASPNRDDVHIDSALTSLVVAWGQGEYIADFLAPPVTTPERTGKVFKDDQGTLQSTNDDSRVAPGAPAHETDWDMDAQLSFSVVDYKRKKTVPDVIVADQTSPLNVMERTARKVANQIALERELRVASLLQTAGSYASANQIAAPATKWDDADTSDPEHMDDIEVAHQAIADAIGQMGNTFACNIETAFALIRKDDFVNRVKYVDRALPAFMLGLIAQYTLCEQAYIGMARYQSSNPGQSSETRADVWSDAPMILYVDPNPSTMYFGFAIQPATDVGTASRWRHPEPDRASDVVMFQESRDELVCNNAAGAILQDVLT